MRSINFWNKQLLQNLMKKLYTRHFVKIWEELWKQNAWINLAEVCWYDGSLKAIMKKTLCICAGHKVFSHKSFDLNHISTVWQKHAAPQHQRICPENVYQFFSFFLISPIKVYFSFPTHVCIGNGLYIQREIRGEWKRKTAWGMQESHHTFK